MSVKWNVHAMTMLTAPTLLVVSSASVTLATLGMEQHVQVSGADPEIEKVGGKSRDKFCGLV